MKPRIALLLVAGVLVVAGLGVVGWFATSFLQRLTSAAPSTGTVVVAANDTKAAIAEQTDAGGTAARDAAAWLSTQPTAYWLTPEAAPAGQVGDKVIDLAGQARAQDAALAIVVYGLPNRDCLDDQSAGGVADAAAYDVWTAEIGAALGTAGDVQRIVVLEPDSLALTPQCGNLDARVEELRSAVKNLAGTNTWIYLDGGHSDWLPPGEMADLIERVGETESIRGFATNVSNYNSTDDEIVYAHALSAETGGLHALVDTSRNGAGDASTWCNPSGQLVGTAGGSMSDDVVDTNLWIKPPGESDGTCNGGPAAGEWWPDAAIQLTREVVG